MERILLFMRDSKRVNNELQSYQKRLNLNKLFWSGSCEPIWKKPYHCSCAVLDLMPVPIFLSIWHEQFSTYYFVECWFVKKWKCVVVSNAIKVRCFTFNHHHQQVKRRQHTLVNWGYRAKFWKKIYTDVLNSTVI